MSDQNQQNYFLLFLVGVSFFVFYITCELSVRMEHTVNFDYANPLYLVIVVSGIGSLSSGTYAILSCLKLTKKRESDAATETAS